MDAVDDAIVRVEGIVKTFRGECALDGITLAFEPGMIYGLLGPNGAQSYRDERARKGISRCLATC